MVAKLVLGLVVCSLFLVSGCATKRYGRMQPVTGYERQNYSCDDIELELQRIVAFRQQISEGAEINIASVGGFLGDFGIGNAMEKNAAERTANERETELRNLKSSKGCP